MSAVKDVLPCNFLCLLDLTQSLLFLISICIFLVCPPKCVVAVG